MRKVFIIPPGEDWVVDRMVKEICNDTSIADWVQFQPETTSNQAYIMIKALSGAQPRDLIWLLADWCWGNVPHDVLKRSRVLTTVHHITPGKHDQYQWDARDKITTAYHVFNERTFRQVKLLTSKPVHLVPYWVNDQIWTPMRSSVAPRDIRLSLCLPEGCILVGSAQRDTEGAGIARGVYLPKLEKGADRLADAFIKLHQRHPDLHVVLAGWRRQYVIGRLEQAGIPYSYFELPSQQVLNSLYNVLDLYVVTARHEGGPQALLECGLTGTPCISTPVGIAEQVLPPSAISDDVTEAIPTVPNVTSINIPGFSNHDMRISQDGMKPYLKLLESI